MSMDRRDFLKKGSLLAAGSTLAGGKALGSPATVHTNGGKTAASNPNIVFIFADQFRPQSMGCYLDDPGADPKTGDYVQTPNFDYIAQTGIRFTNALSNCPVCSPYRGMLMTGRYPYGTGILKNLDELNEEAITLGEICRDAGYNCAYIGKWHLNGYGVNHQWVTPGARRHGFDHYWAANNFFHLYYDHRFFYYENDDPEAKNLPVGEYCTVHLTDLALDWLDSVGGGPDPFCLFMSWSPPHDPYYGPTDYMSMYDAGAVPLRPNLVAPNPWGTEAEWRESIRGYYAAITCLDDQIGRILDKIASFGPDAVANTVVCFSSDHGDMLGSQGERFKQRPWEESIRVPMLIRWPGTIPGNEVSDRLVSSPDIFPTLLSLCGLTNPPENPVDGLDFSEHILDPTNPAVGPDPEGAPLMIIQPAGTAPEDGIQEWRGVRTKTATYARLAFSPWVLYNNVVDPYQLNNLAGNANYLGLQSDMDDLLFELLEGLGDPFGFNYSHVRGFKSYR